MSAQDERSRQPLGGGAVYPWERALGARPAGDRSCEFRVWAPRAKSISVSVRDQLVELDDAGHGIHEVLAPARAGDDYWFVIGEQRMPDPCSRWQPEGLRGPSRVVDRPRPRVAFEPPALEELVIYELHIGSFTPEGSFAAAIPHL